VNKIKILDGAMGTELISSGEKLPHHIWSASINLTNPNLIYNIHKKYINKGVDYITTNTFRTTPRSFKKIGLNQQEACDMARKSFDLAIDMAKKASDGKVKILGSIAPLEDCYLPSLFPESNEAKKEFEQLGDWFNKSEIDIIILETMNSIIETETCLQIIKNLNIPIWVSYNLLNSKQIRSGELLIDAIKILDKYSVECLLLNCNPLNRTLQGSETIKNNWDKNWGIYPNIGIGEPSPNGIIENYYTDEEFSIMIDRSIKLGVNILGGCCGSSFHHIDLIKNQILK